MRVLFSHQGAEGVGQSGSAGGCGCPWLSIPEPACFIPVAAALSSQRVNPGMAARAPSRFHCTDPVPGQWGWELDRKSVV